MAQALVGNHSRNGARWRVIDLASRQCMPKRAIASANASAGWCVHCRKLPSHQLANARAHLLPIVEIVPGTETPLDEGKSGAIRCVVRYADQSTRAAVVKRLPPENVAAEVFCALLLRGWGLSVPEPAIVKGPPIAFASIELSYPNLKHRIGWSDNFSAADKEVLINFGARLVAGFAQTPLALAADEAIENKDRHFGNILWDGADAAWIDHDQSLRVGTIVMDDVNKLALFACIVGSQDAVRQAAVAISLTLGKQAIDEALTNCAAVPNAAKFGPQVAARLRGLAASVLARFPQPDDLLKEADGAR